jgi:SPP1 gp7 family putative phage head morphogenesis protein
MADFYDATVRHAIYLERYKVGLIRRTLAKLRLLSDDLYRLVAGSNAVSRRDMNILLKEIEDGIRGGYIPITNEIETSLRALGVYEAEWQVDTLRRIGVVLKPATPSNADIWSAMYSRPFQGVLLKDWLSGLPEATSARVRASIRQGFTDGRTSLEIARDIRGTRTRKGIMDISARGSEAMVRTAIAHTANAARDRTYGANRTIKQVQWLSVLDHRTSGICRARDGEIFAKNKGPRPPAHIGCRSTMIPVTERNRERVEARETYDQWLRRQSNDTQDDILGNRKGELFRGGLTLDRFVDETGQEYTLDQLRRRDAGVWESSGG